MEELTEASRLELVETVEPSTSAAEDNHTDHPADLPARASAPQRHQVKASYERAYDERPSRIEVKLEYGHLYRDVGQLSSQFSDQNIVQLMVIMSLVMILPMMLLKLGINTVDGIGVALGWLVAIVFGQASSMAAIADGFCQALHAMVSLFIPTAFLAILYVSLFRGLKFNPFEPANLIISTEGIHKQWTGWLSIRSRLHSWSDLTGVAVRDAETKGTHEKKLILSFGEKHKVVIDLLTIRTVNELQVLSRAIKTFVPEGVLGEEIDIDIFNSESVGTRYTEIWTQALLSQPRRTWTQALPPGTKMNEERLEIISKIGAGGQGTVYLAKRLDLNDKPDVVLKEYILPDSSEAHDRRRALKSFEQEIAMLGKLASERIVTLYDVFVQDQRAYLVLEYVDGPPLSKIVAGEGAMTDLEVVDLGIQMCEILICLHNQNPPIIHQDFTPDNLLVSSSKLLKLVDFNVTREALQIKTALVVGKQAYMPPEQFKGKATTQSDLYALGATMFYLIAGQEPEALSVCRPQKAKPEVDAGLADVVSRATALELAERYATAEALKKDLEEIRDRLRPVSSADSKNTEVESVVTEDKANHD